MVGRLGVRGLERLAPRPLRVRVELERARLSGLLRVDHVHDGVDEREVRERLRKVAEVASAARVDLFRVELQWTRMRQELLAQVACVVDRTDLDERRDEPERADREGALP